jgi:tetratricopeptide (TPR) repeat protein
LGLKTLPAELEQLAGAALPKLEAIGDYAGLVWVWHALGSGAANFRCRFEEVARAAEQAMRYERLAGHSPGSEFGFASGVVNGSRPASESLASLDRLFPDSQRPSILLYRALLLAMLDRIEEAWSIALPAAERAREINYGGEAPLAQLAKLAGDESAAERHLATYCVEVEERGDLAVLSTYAPMRGRALCALGRYDEAEILAQRGRELGSPEDLYTQALWRQVQALVLASRGEYSDAERLAREAVAIAGDTDMLELQGDCYRDLGEVLEAAGRRDDAVVALREAVALYERKEIAPLARRTREWLATLELNPV